MLSLGFFFNLETLSFQIDISLADHIHLHCLLILICPMLGSSNIRIKIFESFGAEHDSHFPNFSLFSLTQIYLLLRFFESLLPGVLKAIKVHLASNQVHQPWMLHHLQGFPDSCQEVFNPLVLARYHTKILLDLSVVKSTHIASLLL